MCRWLRCWDIDEYRYKPTYTEGDRYPLVMRIRLYIGYTVCFFTDNTLSLRPISYLNP